MSFFWLDVAGHMPTNVGSLLCALGKSHYIFVFVFICKNKDNNLSQITFYENYK